MKISVLLKLRTANYGHRMPRCKKATSRPGERLRKQPNANKRKAGSVLSLRSYVHVNSLRTQSVSRQS